MALATGVQSLLFYVLACTPCYQVASKRQEKKKAKRDLVARAIMEKENPDMYMHPLPQQTNIFWSEEISLGPTFHKNGAPLEKSRTFIASSGKDSISPSSRTGTNISNPFESGSETGPDSVADTISQYKKTRYQRIEEEIWGHELLGKVGDAVSNVGKNVSHAGKKMSVVLRIDKTEVANRSDDNDFRMPRAPPVNELHPPIVTTRPSKRAYQWMLQPPPPAKFMEGRSTVSRAPSTASTGTIASRSTCRRKKRTTTASGDGAEISAPPTPTGTSNANMSEADLINTVIGQPRSRAELINGPESADSGSSSDNELVKQRRNRVRSITAKELEADFASGEKRFDFSRSKSTRSSRRPHSREAAYEMQTPMTMANQAPVLPHIVV